MKKIVGSAFVLAALCTINACNSEQTKTESNTEMNEPSLNQSIAQQRIGIYTPFKLTADVSHLSQNQKACLGKLIEAAKLMDELFWKEAIGAKAEFLASLTDSTEKAFAEINYGPWDRLNGNASFITAYGEKPAGAQYYPADMTKEEFEAWDDPNKTSLYTMIVRNDAGALQAVWMHEYFETEVNQAATLLREADELAENESFKTYLKLRAEALLTDDYTASDIAWMDIKDNALDVIIGPIENYEDKLFGYKAAHEAYVLIKDQVWSKKLEQYVQYLPTLQEQLPVDPKYKAEKPGSDSQLAAYDVVFYAGDCNAGSKTIAVNLPNDEEIQKSKGTRRSQLKNAMRAKYDKIMLPISEVLIDPSQRQYLSFDAFFENTMFHEVAHGLGIKNTIDGASTAREALKEQYSAIEEGKADILGLYMVTKLQEMEVLDVNLMNNYVTFMAGIFRSVRFGASSAHGKANMLRFNYFQEKGAFTRNDDGTYKINFELMQEAMNSLSALILQVQGDGNYAAAKDLTEKLGVISPELQADLDRLNDAGIPVDIVFDQGAEVLGL